MSHVPIRPNARDEQNRLWLLMLVVGFVLGVFANILMPWSPSIICDNMGGRVCSNHYFADNDQDTQEAWTR